jgi:hypothetical protein
MIFFLNFNNNKIAHFDLTCAKVKLFILKKGLYYGI